MTRRKPIEEASGPVRPYVVPPAVETARSSERSAPPQLHMLLQRKKRDDRTWSVTHIAALQRMAGNRAVAQVIPATVQRQPSSGSGGTTGAVASGSSVSLSHAASFDGKVLSDAPGWKENKGQCATGVQWVFYKAGKPLGKTATWKQGPKVRGNNIPPGTAIASFRNGKFANDHAAILISEEPDGLWVRDQFTTPPKPWGKRFLKFTKDKKDLSNNGDLFYVIVH